MSEHLQTSAPMVLIVDDEVDITVYLRHALEEHGFRVVTYSDAEEAAAALRESEPDVVCLDLLMPRQTGLSLYAEIVKNPRLSDRLRLRFWKSRSISTSSSARSRPFSEPSRGWKREHAVVETRHAR